MQVNSYHINLHHIVLVKGQLILHRLQSATRPFAVTRKGGIAKLSSYQSIERTTQVVQHRKEEHQSGNRYLTRAVVGALRTSLFSSVRHRGVFDLHRCLQTVCLSSRL
jgi:hypothetical protein